MVKYELTDKNKKQYIIHDTITSHADYSHCSTVKDAALEIFKEFESYYQEITEEQITEEQMTEEQALDFISYDLHLYTPDEILKEILEDGRAYYFLDLDLIKEI